MTKFMIPSLGWAYLVVVLDWYTRQIVGHAVGLQSKSTDWLEALNHALNRQFPDGVRGQGLHLMSDNGSQPTSVAFIKACANLEIEQAFTSYNNPKGNANTERVIRPPRRKGRLSLDQRMEHPGPGQKRNRTVDLELQPSLPAFGPRLLKPGRIRAANLYTKSRPKMSRLEGGSTGGIFSKGLLRRNLRPLGCKSALGGL